MKILVITPKSGTPKYLSDYKKIFAELKKHVVSIETTFQRTYLNDVPKLKKIEELAETENTYRYLHDSAIKRAIFRADAIVIEATYPSFRLGFEAFFALSQQKPILVISKKRNYGKLINQPNFFGAKYNDFTLPDEIEKFVRHVRQFKLRHRFNLFISDVHKNHLDQEAKKYNISMSDYIRKLIEKDM